MLIRLEVENFYSIRDRQILDLRLPRTTPDDPSRYREVKPGVRVPSVAALFGPNASGKSTLLRAIGFIERFTTRSFEQIAAGKAIPVKPFACDECKARPTIIALEFSANPVWYDGKPTIYRYEVKIQRSGESNFVAR